MATTGGVNVSTLAINPGANKPAKLTLGGSDEAFSLVKEPGASGAFQIVHNGQPTFSIDGSGSVMVNGLLDSKGAFKTEGTVSYMSTPQWSIHALEKFENGAAGWSNTSVSDCGQKTILGGCQNFAAGETYKTYTGLPDHAQVRVKANFHMIDAWGGESAYMKLEDHYSFVSTFDAHGTKPGINICCDEMPESQFSIPIDVILPHVDPFLKVTFGSTLTGEKPGVPGYWGVDGIQVMTRKA